MWNISGMTLAGKTRSAQWLNDPRANLFATKTIWSDLESIAVLRCEKPVIYHVYHGTSQSTN